MDYLILIALISGVFTGVYILPKMIIWRQNPKYFFTVWQGETKSLPKKIKRRIWNKHLLLCWHKLWIRKGEFHESLDMDRAAMAEMSEKEIEKYHKNLVKRRERYRDKKR